MLNVNIAIEDLIDAIKKYQNQSIVVSSSNGMQVLDNVDIIVMDDCVCLNSDGAVWLNLGLMGLGLIVYILTKLRKSYILYLLMIGLNIVY